MHSKETIRDLDSNSYRRSNKDVNIYTFPDNLVVDNDEQGVSWNSMIAWRELHDTQYWLAITTVLIIRGIYPPVCVIMGPNKSFDRYFTPENSCI